MDINSQLFEVSWFTDSFGKKISILRTNEQYKVVNNVIRLRDIPDRYYKVFITGYTEIENTAEITSTTQFKVNYDNGEITVNASLDGTTITIAKYYGKGRIKIYADNVVLDDEDNLYNSDNVEDFATEITQRVDNLTLNTSNPGEVTDAHVSALTGTTSSTLKARLESDSSYLDGKMGDLLDLQTTDKTSVIEAINELQANIASRIINVKYPPPPLVAAVGDGTTDDTTAIQAAIDACPVLGIVWIPSNTFKVTQLTISGKSNIKIIGSGQLKGSADTVVTSIFGVIYITNSTDIEVSGLNISGMFNGADDRGLWVADSHNVNIRNNRITNFSQEAIMCWGANNSTESTNHIEDNYILGNNKAIVTQTNGEYWEINRNKIIDNNYGFYGAFGNCRIDNNLIIQNLYGIWFDGSLGSNPDHSSITNNQINHNRAIGLYIANLTSGETISGNEILSTVGPEVWGTTGKSHGLVMINVKHVRFTNNQVDANTTTSSWMHIDGHTDCKYINNIFRGGIFKEISIGVRNVFAFNTYTSPCVLTLYSGSDATTLRYGETDDTTFMGTANNTTNKIEVTAFQNGWTNDIGYYPLTYWKDGEGCVHIQGSITGGTVTTNIFNLPAEYRPSAAVDVIAIANNTGDIAGFRIYANGDVQQLSGGNTHVSINAMFKP